MCYAKYIDIIDSSLEGQYAPTKSCIVDVRNNLLKNSFPRPIVIYGACGCLQLSIEMRVTALIKNMRKGSLCIEPQAVSLTNMRQNPFFILLVQY